jgi:HD-GYP domain-containing protein (c-di-GMP phosphodiesterase class II)
MTTEIQTNNLVKNNIEYEMMKRGFENLLGSFTTYLPCGDFESYFRDNTSIAREIALNDIAYREYIEAFHLFEDSYVDVLSAGVKKDAILKYLSAIDKLHHDTISVVSEAYFDVKDTTVFALAKLAELRDPETGYHLERTREYSVLLAGELQMDENFIRQIYKVGPLHDIGKVGIRDSILLKTSGLTSEEYDEMKKHTIIGCETIESIIGDNRVSRGYLLMAREITRCHHEKYDGTGYPNGLKGEEIPLL